MMIGIQRKALFPPVTLLPLASPNAMATSLSHARQSLSPSPWRIFSNSQSFEDLLHKDPESFITALPTFPVAVGLRVIDSHFRGTPLTGYCTAHVLHEITNGAPSRPILHKDGRQSLVTTIEFLQRNTREAHLGQAHGALSTYLEQLQNTETDTFASAHWMSADLLTGICNTIETSTTLLDGRHPVPLSCWMDAAGSPTAWQSTGAQPSIKSTQPSGYDVLYSCSQCGKCEVPPLLYSLPA
jgi:hypothetical protein